MQYDVPRIALTPGEPAGIGPELVLKLALLPSKAEWIAVADPNLLRARAQLLKIPVELEETNFNASPCAHVPGKIKVYPVKMRGPSVPSVLSTQNVPYVLETLRQAAAFCLDGTCLALVTGPIHKGIINEAGIPFTGHTEFLAKLCGKQNVVMMLATPELKVALVTTHLPLKDVPAAITFEKLQQTIRILGKHLKIAVCGLNPHAGENGYLGDEEQKIIIPTLEMLRAEGFCLEGPLPADTTFTTPILSKVDVVLAMYHDQGLPVLKSKGFGQAVNVTLGLPFVRTSCDHGTALDLAGTGKASVTSLQRALEYAIHS